MSNFDVILKIIIWNQILRIISSSGSNSLSEWKDWIIIPARSKMNFKENDNLSAFDVNLSKSGNDSSKEIESYIMRSFNINDNNLNQQSLRMPLGFSGFERNSNLVIPLGRTIEKIKGFCSTVMEFWEENSSSTNENQEKSFESSRKLKKIKKKYKKFLFPLLLAYKLKFLALIPLLMGGLVLLVGTTGMAGFFFALFTAVMSLRSDNKGEVKKW